MTTFYLNLNTRTVDTEDPTLAPDAQLIKVSARFPRGTELTALLSHINAIINQTHHNQPLVYEIQIGDAE
jgi:hypothetical protein